MRKNIYATSVVALLLLQGCSLKSIIENPLGVGFEHSSCESSPANGVCGAPEDIYRYRDIIRSTQEEYLSSGIEKELFFAINHAGKILVKDERGGKWRQYIGSKYQKEAKLNQKKRAMSLSADANGISKMYPSTVIKSSLTQDIPVTKNNDLSIKYKREGAIVETRTNIGTMIRNNGIIQRVWVAPVENSQGSLVSVHDLYAVTKEPSWTVGEKRPKHVGKGGKKPTPISIKILGDTLPHDLEDYVANEKEPTLSADESLTLQDFISK